MLRFPLLALAGTVALTLTVPGTAHTQNASSPDLPPDQDPFVAAVMADPLFKPHFETLIACAAADLPKVRAKCYAGTAAFAERLAVSQGWDIDALKATLSGGSKPETEASENDPPGPISTKWHVRTETSAIDDSTNVYLMLESDAFIRARFGQAGPMRLFVQCRENTTLLYFHFNGHFMSDYSNGTVTYRLDSKKAARKRMQESNDHEALGLWSGARSIPFIKAMFGHDKLLVRATPHSESALTATFSIAGLEEEIAPLRTACHW